MDIVNRKLPAHEQLIFCLLLTIVGGFYDAYTFVNCAEIFANAQTGNLIFIGLSIIDKQYDKVLHFAVPILSFIVGTILSKGFEYRYAKISTLRYTYMLLFTQLTALIFIYFKYNIFGIDIRPVVISFICAVQYSGFTKINNLVFASVFCTGNLRSASEHLFKYLFLKQKSSIKALIIYLSVILVFLLGVIIGAFLSRDFHNNAIIFPMIIIIINILFVKSIKVKLMK